LVAAVLAVLIVSNPEAALSVLRFAGMYVAPVMAIVSVVFALWFRELGRNDNDKETARYSYIVAILLVLIAALLVVGVAYSYAL
jgi:hypothetical protein